jgi:outer membrane murein-binding lipoprotein Lpp
MAKLEQTVQANHAQQGKHVQDLASQIAQVQHNVDQQGKAFQAHLDDKLDKQLQQIEHLLAKRSRTE